jgi:small-conductance mechanosensitive channel
MDWLVQHLGPAWHVIVDQLDDSEFYAQIVIALAALPIAWVSTTILRRRVSLFKADLNPGLLFELRQKLRDGANLLGFLIAAIVFGVATLVSEAIIGHAWLLRLAQGIAVTLLLYKLARHFIGNQTIVFILKWIGVPIALLFAVDWLDEVTGYLDGLDFHLGNIRVSLYIVLRTFVFGALLFWLGRLSNKTGQRVIRNHAGFDVTTREVVAKIFEIGVFVAVFLLLLNVMGVDLTALAVFGGALGVGLGFGLQQIAANFISGLIILMDRTITIGDYIELEDGRAGRLRELTMRSATLETYDGRDIMVPNERFITTAFVNWTHHNQKQRYSLNFQVAYKTDLEKLFPIVRDIVASHPKVLSGGDLPISERPDAEIQSFDDSGITILVEFWMEGIDDGDNRVGADLLMMIWTALKANGIEIPFPQREIKIVGEGKDGA